MSFVLYYSWTSSLVEAEGRNQWAPRRETIAFSFLDTTGALMQPKTEMCREIPLDHWSMLSLLDLKTWEFFHMKYYPIYMPSTLMVLILRLFYNKFCFGFDAVACQDSFEFKWAPLVFLISDSWTPADLISILLIPVHGNSLATQYSSSDKMLVGVNKSPICYSYSESSLEYTTA